jgi:hypothetical protein
MAGKQIELVVPEKVSPGDYVVGGSEWNIGWFGI